MVQVKLFAGGNRDADGERTCGHTEGRREWDEVGD